MTIRRAGPQDLPAIAAIQAASPEASQWDPIDYLNHECWVTGGGFLVARQTAPGEHEILNLAVAPEQRRKGLARKLLEHALAGSSGDWFLEVRQSNLGAICLYQSAGFQAVGERSGYYVQSPESAIVMRLRK